MKSAEQKSLEHSVDALLVQLNDARAAMRANETFRKMLIDLRARHQANAHDTIILNIDDQRYKLMVSDIDEFIAATA